MLANQKGENATALDLIKKAFQIFPQNPIYHNNLGNVYRDGVSMPIRWRVININRLGKPLSNTARFVRNLEDVYSEMWRIFLEGRAATEIKVSEV